jgi:hypothetical protein
MPEAGLLLPIFSISRCIHCSFRIPYKDPKQKQSACRPEIKPDLPFLPKNL